MEFVLNEEQIKAVTTTEGYVRVIAGAGSGKTRALTSRYAYLVNELGILPENILCVTFTNKAANEMRQRIHDLIGDQDTAFINTFHGFCVSVLKEDSHAIHYPKAFLVLDNSDIDSMLRIIYEERGLSLRDRSFSDARDMIEIRKIFKEPEYYRDVLSLSQEELHAKYAGASDPDDIIFYGYLWQQKKCFGLDYNDLIIFTLYIFGQDADIRLKWQQRLEYIMIDEFQDIDSLQYRLMEVLCAHHKNLFIVGDPDQTIYTWRGANVRYLLEFDQHFQPCRTVMMMKNYRSTPQIINAVNSLIAKNTQRIKKDLLPVLEDGSPVSFNYALNAEAEAAWIAGEIAALHAGGVPCSDMAVLYRAHYVTRTVEETLIRKHIPYRIYSGIQFFCRAEIKDALSYLRMISVQDDLSFRRIVNLPKRNVGQRRMEFLERYAVQHSCTLYEALKRTLDDDIFKGTKAAQFVRLIDSYASAAGGASVSEIFTSVLDKSGYEAMLRLDGSQERLDNLAELKQSIYEYETMCGEEATPEHYLAHVAMFTNTDTDDTGDRVKLMTVHAAKGLEFPLVFLCGMNEGIFPSRKIRDQHGMEEERRLAFVAMTRAEKRLFLSAAAGRNFDGSPRYPSRFVLDIDPPLVEYTQKLSDSLIADTREYIRGNRLHLNTEQAAAGFAKGTRVRHEYLGEGTVLKVDHDHNNYLIKFDKIATPRSIAFRVKLTAI